MRGSVLISLLLVSGCAAFEPVTASAPDYNQYWDGGRAPAVEASTDCSLGAMRARFAAYMAPPMMAIGDSLYNGVTSLYVNWWTAEWSAPSLVAVTTGDLFQIRDDRVISAEHPRRFFVPQYPGHGKRKFGNAEDRDTAPQFGLDIEALPTLSPAKLLEYTRQAAANVKALQAYTPPNGRYLVDNIAFSGADTFDLIATSDSTLRQRLENVSLSGKVLQTELEKASRGSLLAMASMADAFNTVNASFVLNPMKDPCIGTLTPVQQVMLRQPKRVLINIGSNNGIWAVAFSGQSIDHAFQIDDYPVPRARYVNAQGIAKHLDVKRTSIRQFIGETYIDHIALIIQQLSSDPSIEHVYINGLIPPSRVANLRPDSTDRIDPHYYSFYKLDFSIGPRRRVPGARIRDADLFVAQQNAVVRRLIDAANRKLRNPRKFRLIDLEALSADKDYKHLQSEASRLCSHPTGGSGCYGPHNLSYPEKIYLDNLPLHFTKVQMRRKSNDELVGYVLQSGGIFSFDNMHLSTAGYGLLAQWIAEEIRRNEPQLVPASYYRDAHRMISPHELYLARNYRGNSFLRNGRPDMDENRERISRIVDIISFWLGGRVTSDTE